MSQTPRLKFAFAIGLVISVLGGAMGGCYNSKQIQEFLQTPHRPVSGVDYRVLPPDGLLIKSEHIPEIDGVRQLIRPDGKINLPLLGELSVVEKTPREIEEEINKLARKYYAEVDANVQIIDYNSQKFYVFGEVRRAGPFPWTGCDSLLDALARAQPTFLSWPEHIVVVRGGNPQVGGCGDRKPSLKYNARGVYPDDKNSPPKKLTINLWAMVKSGDMTNNILLMPNDVIYVRPNPLAQLGMAIQTLLLPIRPAAETIRVPVGTATAMGG
jgi:polysaccharide export outer membrane protein